MPRSATTQTRPMPNRLRRRSITGTSTLTSAVLPGHISEQTVSVDHHAQDPLYQIRPVALRIAGLPQAGAAGADKAERRSVHEHHRQLAEQVPPGCEPLLLDEVLHRARGEWRGPARLLGRQFLAEPRHRPIE